MLLGMRSTLLGFTPASLFVLGEEGAWYDPSDLSTMFTDTSGTTPAAAGDAVARINDKSGNNANATQATTTARPILRQDADGKYYLQNDEVDDALTVTFPNLGSDCTVGYVTASEVFLYEGQTISGAYTLPATDLYNIVVIDRELTLSEKINLIRYLASKVDGVNYGGEIDRLTLIAINAVDVFVYDTSKDSDGGAWRNNTSSTSWYNETLNTATRGSRRQFPAVAVIVAEAAKVTIYDGDDPSLPMWMVFNTANNRLVRATTVSSIAMQNGVLAVGSSDSGFSRLDFISEQCLVKTSAGYAFPVQLISFRNTGQSIALDGSAGLVSALVNDVAMTVLPGAPIDPATGLPVPTIAVATAGGVSVINNDGTVADSTVTFPGVVLFNEDGRLYFSRNTFGGNAYYADPDEYASDVFGVAYGNTNTTAYPLIPLMSYSPIKVWAVTDKTSIASGGANTVSATTPGLSIMKEVDATSGAFRQAKITSTFNTGWMNGNIKGAFLSDTDDTDLVASGELVTNGTFDTDLSGWTLDAGYSNSVVSGQLVCDRNGDTDGYGLYQSFTTVVGKTYTATVDIISLANGGRSRIMIGTSAYSLNLGGATSITPAGTYSYTFVATTTTTFISLGVDFNSAGIVTYDNISVQLADADRSVNRKGLIVNGTITRTAVASGADLVAYSGFSASNYLEQPYNSALNFGTGDFCYMGWFSQPASAFATIIDRFASGRTGAGIEFRLDTNARLFVYTQNASGAASYVYSAATSFGFGAPNLFAAVRRAGALELYINGIRLAEQSSVTPTVARDINVSAAMRVGSRVNGTFPFNGSLALLRISATAPTAEQIAKIYNDELPLFQVNARATLYGASDAVTALAHDPDTGLLHVGTSAGRSVFRGLERLSNTTTSVAATISASGGLVVSK